MPRGAHLAKATDAEFVAAWYQHNGSPAQVAKALGLTDRAVYLRRDALNAKGIKLESVPTGNAPAQWQQYKPAYERERRVDMWDGTILVGSDLHRWPGEYTTAMRAFLNLIPEVKPNIIVANGDWLDGAGISRHGRIGWARTPTLHEEIRALQEFTTDVEQAAFANDPQTLLAWNVGNHCGRADSYLSSRAPEVEGMPLTRLEDHFTRWQFQWSQFVNPDGPHPVVIKHRGPSGSIHGGYNNTLKGGVSVVTGHTHILEVKPWGDYRSPRRYGVQTGCMADLDCPQFEYTENNASPACSGFVVLTIRDGQLRHPELCEVIGGRAFFRNEIVA